MRARARAAAARRPRVHWAGDPGAYPGPTRSSASRASESRWLRVDFGERQVEVSTVLITVMLGIKLKELEKPSRRYAADALCEFPHAGRSKIRQASDDHGARGGPVEPCDQVQQRTTCPIPKPPAAPQTLRQARESRFHPLRRSGSRPSHSGGTHFR